MALELELLGKGGCQRASSRQKSGSSCAPILAPIEGLEGLQGASNRVKLRLRIHIYIYMYIWIFIHMCISLFLYLICLYLICSTWAGKSDACHRS